MKKCPRCGQTYTDTAINFCLNDGELLSYQADDMPQTVFSGDQTNAADDSPPTLMMNTPRVTNQTNWGVGGPMTQWQNPQPEPVNHQYGAPAFSYSKDQTLPTISLVLGIIACVFVCCYGGVWLGVPAAIVGFLGMRNADNDPSRYSGRGLAIAGMVLGIITFLISFVFIIITALPK